MINQEKLVSYLRRKKENSAERREEELKIRRNLMEDFVDCCSLERLYRYVRSDRRVTTFTAFETVCNDLLVKIQNGEFEKES